MNDYGKELILDIHNCDPDLFTKSSLKNYFKQVCTLIDMERCRLHWWDDLDRPDLEPHLVGLSAVQFIKTSNITIHTLTTLKRVYLNIFSCKDFDENVAAKFSISWFKGTAVQQHTVKRI